MKKHTKEYLDDPEVLYKGRDDKFICLMDLALLAMKKLKSEGKLQIRKSLMRSMPAPSWYR
jgi:phosphoribosylformylglycinamidine synthase